MLEYPTMIETFDANKDVAACRRVNRKANWLKVWKKCPVPIDDVPRRNRELPKKAKTGR
jgi:hypothetical protein